jgi:uncharacterized protein (TIGR03437 family)
MIAFAQTVNTPIAPALVVAPDGPWPPALSGAHLDIIDSQNQTRAAPIYYVSPSAMTYLVPPGTAAGQGVARLTTSTGAIVTGLINVVPVSAGLYSIRATGSGSAAGIFIRASGGAQSFGYLFDSNLNPIPVDLGPSGDQIFLSLYGTGFRGASQVKATLGGLDVDIAAFGATGIYQGEDLINIGPIPRSLAGRGELALVITFDSKPANTVSVSIR